MFGFSGQDVWKRRRRRRPRNVSSPKSKVQTFGLLLWNFHPFFSSCLSSILGGATFGVLDRFHPTFAVLHSGFPVFIPLCGLHRSFPVFILLLQFCRAVSQFSSHFAVCIVVSRFTVHYITVNSQFASRLSSRFAKCITSQLNPSHDGSSMQLHCMASQNRSLHPSLYRSIAVCIPVCIAVSQFASQFVSQYRSLHPSLYRSIAVSQFPSQFVSQYRSLHPSFVCNRSLLAEESIASSPRRRSEDSRLAQESGSLAWPRLQQWLLTAGIASPLSQQDSRASENFPPLHESLQITKLLLLLWLMSFRDNIRIPAQLALFHALIASLSAAQNFVTELLLHPRSSSLLLFSSSSDSNSAAAAAAGSRHIDIHVCRAALQQI